MENMPLAGSIYWTNKSRDWIHILSIYADWCWLMLIGADCSWLMLINSYWCWFMPIDADWCWSMLIDSYCFLLMLIDAEWCSFIGAYLPSFPGQPLSGPSHAPWAFLSQEWAYICLIWFQESFSWMLKESSCFGAHDHRWHSTLYSWGVFCQKGGHWRQVGISCDLKHSVQLSW